MNWMTIINLGWTVILLALAMWLNRLARKVKEAAQRNLEMASAVRLVAQQNSISAAVNAETAKQNVKVARDLCEMASRMRTHYLLMTRD